MHKKSTDTCFRAFCECLISFRLSEINFSHRTKLEWCIKNQPTHVIELLWRNRLARSAVNPKVGGSSQPSSENSRPSKSEIAAKNMYSKLLISGAIASNSWIWKIRFARLAESVERWTINPMVKGSSHLWDEVTFLLLIFFWNTRTSLKTPVIFRIFVVA